MKKLKVTFFLGIFPVISESWLVEQMTGLIDSGVELKLVAFKRGGEEHVSEKIKKYKLLEKTIFIEFPEDKIKKLIGIPPLLLRALFFRPGALLKLLYFRKWGGIGYSLKYLFWTAPLVGRIENSDVIHCHFGIVGNRYLIIRKILGLKQKFITSFYGLDGSKCVQEKGADYYRELRKIGDYFLPNNTPMRDTLVGIGFPAERTLVHYNVINPENYNFKIRKYDHGENLKMIFVGRFVEKKGIEDLLKAVAAVYEQHKNIELNIVGDGEPGYKAGLVDLAGRLKLAPAVKFHGMVPHQRVLNMFGGMHLFVLLSKKAPDGDTEGLPYVLLEAQASGLPVVSTRHMGIPEAIQDGVSGFLVNEGDYRGAAEKIRLFLDNPQKIAEFSGNANRLVLEKFGAGKLNAGIVGLYQSLCTQN